jgi:hypothetical protein
MRTDPNCGLANNSKKGLNPLSIVDLRAKDTCIGIYTKFNSQLIISLDVAPRKCYTRIL